MASLLCFCVPRMGYEGLRGSAFLRPGVRGAHLSWLSQRPLLLSREIDDLGHLFLYASHFSIPRRPCIILGCPNPWSFLYRRGLGSPTKHTSRTQTCPYATELYKLNMTYFSWRLVCLHNFWKFHYNKYPGTLLFYDSNENQNCTHSCKPFSYLP